MVTGPNTSLQRTRLRRAAEAQPLCNHFILVWYFSMGIKKVHRIVGLILVLPLLAWAATGVVFLTKPGYESAYEKLHVKTYSIDSKLPSSGKSEWMEIRLIQSILGLHLLAKTAEGFKHYDPETFLPAALPTEAEVKRLILDSVSLNPERYGVLDSVDGLKGYTNTGIVITLNWDDMTLRQQGFDRRVIETLYKIHYLQWTKWESVNLLLAIVGLVGLATLTIVGLWLYIYGVRNNA